MEWQCGLAFYVKTKELPSYCSVQLLLKAITVLCRWSELGHHCESLVSGRPFSFVEWLPLDARSPYKDFWFKYCNFIFVIWLLRGEIYGKNLTTLVFLFPISNGVPNTKSGIYAKIVLQFEHLYTNPFLLRYIVLMENAKSPKYCWYYRLQVPFSLFVIGEWIILVVVYECVLARPADVLR